MKNLTTTLMLFSLLSTTPVFAGPLLARGELAQDRQELRQNALERRDDHRDLVQLEALLDRFDAARRGRNYAALDDVDRELRTILAHELREDRLELDKRRAEAARSHEEVARSRQETAAGIAHGAPPAHVEDDRRDAIDDRLDRHDDRHDAAVKAHQHQTRQTIAAQLSPLLYRHTSASLSRKRELLVELIAVARVELEANRQERLEDRQERREDRRELREDLRPR